MIKRAQETLPRAKIYVSYGMTEAAGMCGWKGGIPAIEDVPSYKGIVSCGSDEDRIAVCVAPPCENEPRLRQPKRWDLVPHLRRGEARELTIRTENAGIREKFCSVLASAISYVSLDGDAATTAVGHTPHTGSGLGRRYLTEPG